MNTKEHPSPSAASTGHPRPCTLRPPSVSPAPPIEQPCDETDLKRLLDPLLCVHHRIHRNDLQRLLLRLHNVGELGIPRLIQAQIGRDDRRERDAKCPLSRLRLLLYGDRILLHLERRNARSFSPVEQSCEHRTRLAVVTVDTLFAHEDKIGLLLEMETKFDVYRVHDSFEDFGDLKRRDVNIGGRIRFH